jgi:hypothetical protein
MDIIHLRNRYKLVNYLKIERFTLKITGVKTIKSKKTFLISKGF